MAADPLTTWRDRDRFMLRGCARGQALLKAPNCRDSIRAAQDAFESVRASGWLRSRWDRRRIVHVSADTMHDVREQSHRRKTGERSST